MTSPTKVTPTTADVLAILADSPVPLSTTKILDTWAERNDMSYAVARLHAAKNRECLRTLRASGQVYGAGRHDTDGTGHNEVVPPWADDSRTMWWIHPDRHSAWVDLLESHRLRRTRAAAGVEELRELLAKAAREHGVDGGAAHLTLSQHVKKGDVQVTVQMDDTVLHALLAYLDRRTPRGA